MTSYEIHTLVVEIFCESAGFDARYGLIGPSFDGKIFRIILRENPDIIGGLLQQIQASINFKILLLLTQGTCINDIQF